MILDAGDLFFSTPKLTKINHASELYRASAILEGYGKIGCDAINIGHYEMLGGLPFLKEMDSQSDIPFVSANIRDAKTNELLFDPFIIKNKNGLEIGIIGVTDKVPDTSKAIFSDDFIESGQKYIQDLKNEVDVIVMLVNSDRKTYNDLPENFADADFIVTSGSTNMTRPNNPQKEGGPYLYSCGKQGKYLSVLSVDIKDSKKQIVDISSHETNIKSMNKRLARLQKKDPDKPLKELYAQQANVLKLIDQYKNDLKISEVVIKSASNTIKYETIALNKKIQDNKDLLAFVDESLATCNSLNPKISTKGKRNQKKKRKPKKT